MKVKDIIREYKVHTITNKFQPHAPGGTPVIQDPQVSEIKMLLKYSSFQSLKGIIADNSIYIWDSEKAIHEIVKEQLGFDAWEGVNLEFYRENGKILTYAREPGVALRMIPCSRVQNRSFQRIMQDDEFVEAIN